MKITTIGLDIAKSVFHFFFDTLFGPLGAPPFPWLNRHALSRFWITEGRPVAIFCRRARVSNVWKKSVSSSFVLNWDDTADEAFELKNAAEVGRCAVSVVSVCETLLTCNDNGDGDEARPPAAIEYC